MSTKRSFILAALMFMLRAGAAADESMWPSTRFRNFPATVCVLGLMLTSSTNLQSQRGRHADAVVQVGATGYFVSPDGLILTTHHVTFVAIQQARSSRPVRGERSLAPLTNNTITPLRVLPYLPLW